ncbi:MAG: prepilin-type N-terminal cleavage/methylation domain-containing protein [Alphaproteobacteria bacterium]|nr:prepilin-type N-terminal cleavage/methylation domain-containing protein [Alphaproteobacteria bacterium]MBU2377597.1 prepilin-type N-terminal cleavage/methylation domain-containing protein [Alphaproteobacteria bacterium]
MFRASDTTRADQAKRRRKGFTLIEVLIALGLFALIGVAGFTLLDSVLRTQDATDTRLSRMAEIQRAMLVVSSDLDQLTGSLAGSGAALSLQKTDLNGGIVTVAYDLSGATLTRSVSGAGGQRVQILLTEVSGLRWTFHRRRGDWLETWPQDAAPVPPPLPGPDGVVPTPGPRPDEGVTAVALDITLTGLDGRPGATLRRVASIPLMEPAPPPALGAAP